MMPLLTILSITGVAGGEGRIGRLLLLPGPFRRQGLPCEWRCAAAR